MNLEYHKNNLEQPYSKMKKRYKLQIPEYEKEAKVHIYKEPLNNNRVQCHFSLDTDKELADFLIKYMLSLSWKYFGGFHGETLFFYQLKR